MRVYVLRIGHRIPRDERITTHVCLTARALGAQGVFISNVRDSQLIETIDAVTGRFGGQFHVEAGRPWRTTLTEWKREGGKVVHLTAYGMSLPRVIDQIRTSSEDKLVVVGAEKVPGEMYELADWNVAVTSQPISEVSALAVFLDWLYEHKRLEDQFPNAKIRIIPTEHGKTVAAT